MAKSLALATKETQKRDVKITREIERLLNDLDNTYAHRMTNLEKRLDAKADLMMQELDEILSGSNRENRPAPMGDSLQASDESGAHICAGAQPRSRTRFEPDHRSRSGWTDPVPPEAAATFIDNATSQISARSDYRLARHDDVRFNV